MYCCDITGAENIISTADIVCGSISKCDTIVCKSIQEKETGITIHRVNGEYDDGEIIAQKKVSVYPSDTAEILAKRVLSMEHIFIVEVLEQIVNNYKKHDVDL